MIITIIHRPCVLASILGTKVQSVAAIARIKAKQMSAVA